MGKRALVVWGGWEGHEPQQVADWLAQVLRTEGFAVEISDTLEAFDDEERLRSFDLLVPEWTMGEISKERVNAVSEAVASGTGLAGLHGGMCDSFRSSVLWQFMTGGNWVAHPGGDGVEYTVNIRQSSSPLTAGIADFTVKSEQYYLHVDPAVEVLATTRFPTVTWYHAANGEVDIPVLWTKRWGIGRVFYCSLGHHADIVRKPEVTEIMRRGFQWTAESRTEAQRQGLSPDIYRNEGKMF